MPNRKTVVKNCKKSSGWQGVDYNINPKRLYALLERATRISRGDVRRAARQLLRELESDSWQITAGPHEGGFGDDERDADQRMHITVRTRKHTYHVRLASNAWDVVAEITW